MEGVGRDVVGLALTHERVVLEQVLDLRVAAVRLGAEDLPGLLSARRFVSRYYQRKAPCLRDGQDALGDILELQLRAQCLARSGSQLFARKEHGTLQRQRRRMRQGEKKKIM